jgi:hypothetical protein
MTKKDQVDLTKAISSLVTAVDKMAASAPKATRAKSSTSDDTKESVSEREARYAAEWSRYTK